MPLVSAVSLSDLPTRSACATGRHRAARTPLLPPQATTALLAVPSVTALTLGGGLIGATPAVAAPRTVSSHTGVHPVITGLAHHSARASTHRSFARFPAGADVLSPRVVHAAAVRKVTRVSARTALSQRVARHAGLLSAVVAADGQRADLSDTVLAEAARHAGAPYSYGAAGPSAFDCSGFTQFVYAQAGITLPRTTWAQYAAVVHLPMGAARLGDLIFLDGLGHVGIYAGDGMIWDSPKPGGVVSRRAIWGPYLVGRVRQP